MPEGHIGQIEMNSFEQQISRNYFSHSVPAFDHGRIISDSFEDIGMLELGISREVFYQTEFSEIGDIRQRRFV